ncbi:hypothetical protein J3R30DRAFT_3735380 [Lentinula aciculospora]|uniref:Uncharacterized protein n=1 Tax=Lentinula aciculospora TaxID=153920 RepID=A0A9W9A6A3_9AGAR|nr:hypothetical protein J3R30DRAFT_3735380 [Lentinula aciculospora]
MHSLRTLIPFITLAITLSTNAFPTPHLLKNNNDDSNAQNIALTHNSMTTTHHSVPPSQSTPRLIRPPFPPPSKPPTNPLPPLIQDNRQLGPPPMHKPLPPLPSQQRASSHHGPVIPERSSSLPHSIGPLPNTPLSQHGSHDTSITTASHQRVVFNSSIPNFSHPISHQNSTSTSLEIGNKEKPGDKKGGEKEPMSFTKAAVWSVAPLAAAVGVFTAGFAAGGGFNSTDSNNSESTNVQNNQTVTDQTSAPTEISNESGDAITKRDIVIESAYRPRRPRRRRSGFELGTEEMDGLD